MSIRYHLSLAEDIILREHNVINADVINTYVSQFISKTQLEAGKKWFQKKLYSFIVNDISFLEVFSDTDLSLMKNVPDFLQAAAERGETLYKFNKLDTSVSTLTARMMHVSDWFNSINIVSERTSEVPAEIEDINITKKWITKLGKLRVEDIVEIADGWYAKMGARIKANKSGVEILMRWPDGYYAVRYTDKDTMITDGNDLQNCLRDGRYWGQGIYGIRKANDEAVVGIRVTNRNVLEECKGKNNKPFISAYETYVVDFLTKLKVIIHPASSGFTDLTLAGLEINDGKIGKFDDIANIIYDKDGLIVRGTERRVVAKKGKIVLYINIAGNKVNEIIENNPAITTDDKPISSLALKILNILQIPPSVHLSNLLQEEGSFYTNSRYGDASEIGKEIFTVRQYRGYEVTTTLDAGSFPLIVIFDGGINHDKSQVRVGSIVCSSIRKIITLRGEFFKEPESIDVIDILNTLNLKPAFEVEKLLNLTLKIYYDKVYGLLEDIGKVDFTVGEYQFIRLGDRKIWIPTLNNRNSNIRFYIQVGILKHNFGLGSLVIKDAIKQAVQQIAVKYAVKSVEKSELFDILNARKGVIADFNTLLSAVKATPKISFYEEADYDDTKIIAYISKMYEKKLSVEQQNQLYEVLKYNQAILDVQNIDKVYDIEIKNIKIELPMTNLLLKKRFILSDDNITKKINSDTILAIKSASEMVEKYDYAKISITNIEDLILNSNVSTLYQKLKDKIKVLHIKTEKATSERARNSDKYATDLSSRFAALNAFRKR